MKKHYFFRHVAKGNIPILHLVALALAAICLLISLVSTYQALSTSFFDLPILTFFDQDGEIDNIKEEHEELLEDFDDFEKSEIREFEEKTGVDFDKFLKDVEKCLKNNNHVLIAVSEGVQTKDGKYIPEALGEISKDSFGHAQLGGTATILAERLKSHFKVKVRAIEFNLMQRCAQHLASEVDVTEAFEAGREAVKAAVSGVTDKMVSFKREYVDSKYVCKYELVDLHLVANAEKKIPLDWINEDQNGLNDKFVEYALPLIQGSMAAPTEDGLPRFAKLKKVLV